jgi:hypothetical protein
MTSLDRARILLSAQRALLGAITHELRVVDLCWNEGEIRLRFTVDSSDDYDMDDIANEIEGEIEGDFLPDVKVTSEVICSPVGNAIPAFDKLDGGNARVFARRE